MLRTFQLSNNIIDSLYDELMFSFEWSNRWADDGYWELNIELTSRFTTALEVLRRWCGIQVCGGTYEDEKGFARICYGKLGSHVFVKNNQINSKELRYGVWELAQLEAKEEE